MYQTNPRSEIRNPKRASGFTLIELLVVMTIIMMLAGLLFPVFGRARAKAKQASCASNLRQCAIALRMYRDEWDDRFPPQNLSVLNGVDGKSPRKITGPQSAMWVGQLYLYLRNVPVMRCTEADWRFIDQLNEIPYGIGMNDELAFVTTPSGETISPKTKISDSNTIVLADCSALFFTQDPDGIMDVAYADAPSGTYKAGDIGNELYLRHYTGSNVAYSDCHVSGSDPGRLQSEAHSD